MTENNITTEEHLEKEVLRLETQLKEAQMWIKRYEYHLATLGELKEGCYSDRVR